MLMIAAPPTPTVVAITTFLLSLEEDLADVDALDDADSPADNTEDPGEVPEKVIDNVLDTVGDVVTVEKGTIGLISILVDIEDVVADVKREGELVLLEVLMIVATPMLPLIGKTKELIILLLFEFPVSMFTAEVEGVEAADIVVFEKKVGITGVVEVEVAIMTPELIFPTTVVKIESISPTIVVNFAVFTGADVVEAFKGAAVLVITKLVDTIHISTFVGCPVKDVSTVVASAEVDPQPYWRKSPG